MMKRTLLLFLASAFVLLLSPHTLYGARLRKSVATSGIETHFGTSCHDNRRLLEWQTHMAQSVERARMMRKSPVVQPDTVLPAANYFGLLNAPDGSVWTYTIDYTMVTNPATGVSTGKYASVHVKVFDSEHALLGEFTSSFENIQSRDSLIIGVNGVEVNPLVTRKCFNIDDNYEVMLFIHAVTSDYTGRYYSDVYSLGTGELVVSLPGNQVLAQDLATDARSEDYYLLFQRDSIKPIKETVIDTTWVDGAITSIDTSVVTTGEDYTMYFDVYNRGYNQTVQLLHTFEVNYSYISGTGSYSVPVMMVKHNNQVCYVTARYEIPFFDPDVPSTEEPVVQPNNNFLLTLHDNKFDTVSTTKIPCESLEGYLYSFPYIGGLRYNDDLAFDFFPEADTAYIVSFDNYVTSSDEFVTSYYVYDLAGNRIKTIAENTEDYLWMSDVYGEEEQYCFFYSSDADATFRFVDIPSCDEVLRLPSTLNGNLLSSTLDRYPSGDTYQYAISLAYGMSDDDGNTIHTIAWLNSDGSLNHYDRLNLGEGIQMAMVDIDASVLDPYLIDTDKDREYLVLVKRLNGNSSSSSDELLYIVNTQGDRLLELGPDSIKGNLSVIYLLNSTTTPMLSVLYNNVSKGTFTPTFTELPLNAFEGSGTLADPYLIATAGDFRRIRTAPSAAFRVVSNLDFNNSPFAGIDVPFTGSIDGQNHTLTHLILDGSGLFHSVTGSAFIVDLRLYSPILSFGDSSPVGFFANTVFSSDLSSPCVIGNVLIYNATVDNASRYDGIFGGIAGEIATGTEISQCGLFDANIVLSEQNDLLYKAHAGGIVGSARTGSKVNACVFTGHLTAGIAAGIVGEPYDQSAAVVVSNCHTNADITGYETAAGVVGDHDRSLVTNCYAEGTIEAKGGRWETKAGGIAGSVFETSSEVDTVVQNCLVGIRSITLPASGSGIYGHRIVGYSRGDNKEPDYKTGKLLPPDTAFISNYVISDLAVMDTLIKDGANTVEGATLSAAEFTSEFLAKHDFALGTNVYAPWQHDGALYLWYEQSPTALIVDNADNNLLIGDKAIITFTLLNGVGIDIHVALDGTCAELISEEAEGDHVAVTIKGIAAGTARLTATYGTLTATATIVCDKQHIGYDASSGAINVRYTASDNVGIVSNDKFHTLSAERADETDETILIFFNEDQDDDIDIPAGTYTIGSSETDWTVLASTGLDMANGTIMPSYYITYASGSAKFYFLVSGTVKVTKLEGGHIMVVVDALNSYDVPVHIEYNSAETANENIFVDFDTIVHKYIRDGQLYIEHNGKTYNATGAVVE